MRIIEAQVGKINPFLCAPSPDEEPSRGYTRERIEDTSMKICNFYRNVIIRSNIQIINALDAMILNFKMS